MLKKISRIWGLDEVLATSGDTSTVWKCTLCCGYVVKAAMAVVMEVHITQVQIKLEFIIKVFLYIQALSVIEITAPIDQD